MSLSLVLCKKDHHFHLKIKKSSITIRIKTSIPMNLTMTKNMMRKNKTFINPSKTTIFHRRNLQRKKVGPTSLLTTIYKNTPLPQYCRLWRSEKLNKIRLLNRQHMICGESFWSLTSRQRKPFQSYMVAHNTQKQLRRGLEDAVSKKSLMSTVKTLWFKLKIFWGRLHWSKWPNRR